MGFEISYKFHPRKAEGGYNTEVTEEKSVKVGKAFDDTPLEKCAAAIMLQLARRDVWVVDVKVFEVVKKEITFKESTDGRAIVLKNKKYQLGSTAEALADDLVEVEQAPPPQAMVQYVPPQIPHGKHPHEMIQSAQNSDLSHLYDSAAPVPVKQTPRPQINQNKTIYYVYFEPLQWINEARRMKLKFTPDRKYPVHAVVPSVSGRLDTQQIAVTDDTGKVMVLDEKFFTTAGRGLLADDQLGFSNQNDKRGESRHKLLHEDELTIGTHPAELAGGVAHQQAQPYKQVRRPVQADIPAGIPVDDGGIPADMMVVPDLRPNKKF